MKRRVRMIRGSVYSLAILLLTSAQSYAETVAETVTGTVADSVATATTAIAEAHGAVEHHASKGLPQLDPSVYPGQAFWLLVVFAVLYVFFSRKTLPDMSSVIENRRERIQNDLDTASRLKDEVSAAQVFYEGSLNTARRTAADTYKNIEESLKAKMESNSRAFQEKASTQISAMEADIEKATDKAMEDMGRIATEIAIEATAKIVGLKVDEEYVKKVVDSVNTHAKGNTAKAA